jgi:ArsR family transcriptional regulator, arsenate/arsenite/antimonite-responsive transcriptional repressor
VTSFLPAFSANSAVNLGFGFFLTGRFRYAIVRHMSKHQTTDLEDYAEAFKALSNPNRLAIFLHLLWCCPPGGLCNFDEEKGKCVGEVGRRLDIAPSTISHHLKELRRSGLIHMEKKGKFTECRVDMEVVTVLADLLTRRLCVEGFADDELLKEAAGG